MKLEEKELITRRDALKRMGLFAAGTALAPLTLPILSSCEKNKKRIIFFFTGTGNCLYIAKQLGEELYSIPQVMKGDKRSFEADEIGLVYPVYFFSTPQIVKDFLYSVKLKADYMFCVQTYGVSPRDASDYLRYHASQNGIHFDYVRSIQMPDNFLPFFDVGTEENLARGKDVPALVAATIADLAEQKHWIEPVPEMRDGQRRKDYNTPEILNQRSETLFTIDQQKCIHCSTCVSICPKGNYEMKGIVSTFGSCLYCLACANACPQKAITVNPREVNPEHRYINPHVSISQIIQANEK